MFFIFATARPFCPPECQKSITRNKSRVCGTASTLASTTATKVLVENLICCHWPTPWPPPPQPLAYFPPFWPFFSRPSLSRRSGWPTGISLPRPHVFVRAWWLMTCCHSSSCCRLSGFIQARGLLQVNLRALTKYAYSSPAVNFSPKKNNNSPKPMT